MYLFANFNIETDDLIQSVHHTCLLVFEFSVPLYLHIEDKDLLKDEHSHFSALSLIDATVDDAKVEQ